MEQFDLLRDLAERTSGNVYIGVVGPVRTGKSTFIRRFMELLVLPNITDQYDRDRTRDALPQSGAGRTIQTTEPKFVPDEAVQVQLAEGIAVNVRLVDCVGYAVDGAIGYTEQEEPRMVLTPWSPDPMPFEQAAEMGTHTVIQEHSTIGLVMTTDGSITELPRTAYENSEERVVNELKEIGKPFLVVLNSAHPEAAETQALRDQLEEKYQVTVMTVNCARVTEEEVLDVLREVLYEFPVQEVTVQLPAWVDVLPGDNWLRGKIEGAVSEAVANVKRLRDIDGLLTALKDCDAIETVSLIEMKLGTGTALMQLNSPEYLFYDVLSELVQDDIRNLADIMRVMPDFASAKRSYVKVAEALKDAANTGYGIVPPSLDEMALEQPEIIRQGNRFGVRLKASAPSLHIIRVDVNSEVAPIVGTERQSEELVQYLLDEFEQNPERLWESNLFGKSLSALVKEGIQNKLVRLPDDAQEKLRETLEKIVNEGSGGLIAILL
jgi:stage IV sporulation protein A